MKLKENLQTERVDKLPLREPILLPPDAPVSKAIELMQAKKLGCVIVTDPEGKPLGAFTERMIIDLLLHHPDNLHELPVGDHLDGDLYTVAITEAIAEVLHAVQRGARFVCVTDEGGRAVGLTGQKSLSEYIADHFPAQVMVQRIGGKQPGMVTREGA